MLAAAVPTDAVMPHEALAIPPAIAAIGNLVDEISEGVALADAGGRLLWRNRAWNGLAAAPNPATLAEAFGECAVPLGRADRFRRRVGERHLDVAVRPCGGDAAFPIWLCQARDVTAEVGQREKLIAIARAGRELNGLAPEELARMSVAERTDLLKANILQYARKILDFRNLEVRLLDPLTGLLTALISEGIDEGKTRELWAKTEGNGVTGFVAATGVSYLCGDVSRDPRYWPGAPNARSSLTAPILDHGKVLGTINVESGELGRFNESDREFLEVYAGEVALALATLELLQAEHNVGRAASVRNFAADVSLPADDIAADALAMLNDAAGDPRPGLERILAKARGIKAAVRRAGSTPDAGKRFAGRRVLLVDADPEVRVSAHELLGQLGCEVDTASSGAEALRFVRRLGHDVVMADIRLPDLNGYEFLLALRDASPTSALVLMTGFGWDAGHTLVKARQAGLRNFLYKPFRFDRLAEALADALRPGAGAGTLSENSVKQSIL